MRWGAWTIALTVVTGVACSRAPEARQYEVRGQILSVDANRRQVLVDHEDIPGFMPAMTMTYQVRDPELLQDKKPGDLFTATLVVEEVSGYLSTLTVTGNAAIKNAGTGPAIMDADLLKEGDVAPEHPLVDQNGTQRRLS